MRDFFTNSGKYYVPPKRDFSLTFCKDILAGRKKLMKTSNIRWVAAIPYWPEFTVRAVWERG